MDNSDASSSRMDTVMPYLHFKGGDNLFFKSWHPSSGGAIARACIVLVVVAVIERLIFAIRGAMEARWRRRYGLRDSLADFIRILASALALTAPTVERDGFPSEEPVAEDKEISEDERGSTRSPIAQRGRTIPPFVFSNDVARGALYSLQALLTYTLMLAVM